MPWIPAGPASADPDAARPRRVATPAGPVLLVPLAGRWHALADRCSHAGCAFSTDGQLEDDRIVCDCHGSEFDVRTGTVLVGPAERPIATFPVRVVGDDLEVEA